MLNKKWKDDLRIITSGPNWDSASQCIKIIRNMLGMEISILLMAHRLHHTSQTKVSRTPNSRLASSPQGGLLVCEITHHWLALCHLVQLLSNVCKDRKTKGRRNLFREGLT